MAHTRLSSLRRRFPCGWVRGPLAILISALPLLWLGQGCGSSGKERLDPPRVSVAPYDTSRGEALWAIVPLRNESGTTLVDVLDVSDKVMGAAAQVRGVRALPVNRTLAAMRALRMSELSTPEDARRLAAEMGVDAILVGSVTAWDPYRPTIGLALALYQRPGALATPTADLADVRNLRLAPTDYRYFPRSAQADAPASVVAEYFDGQNHQVLMDVRQYAQGRHDPTSALGWRRYTKSMPLFTEFAAHSTVERLIEHEWIRLARQGTAPPRAPMR